MDFTSSFTVSSMVEILVFPKMQGHLKLKKGNFYKRYFKFLNTYFSLNKSPHNNQTFQKLSISLYNMRYMWFGENLEIQ